MKAGGKDHSRPTTSPILSMETCPWCGWRSCGQCAAASVRPADVQPDHVLPVRPVVRPAVPEPERVPDALRPEPVREVLVARPHGIVAADRHDDLQALERVDA